MRVLIALVIAIFTCSCAISASKEGPVALQSQAVQWNYGGNYELIGVGLYDTTQTAVGTIIARIHPGNATWFNCGVSFISPHFGVTAAHCVAEDIFTLDTSTFTVQQYNTQTLSNWNAVIIQALVGGTWPNYTRGTRLQCNPDGYCLSGWYQSCRVRVRCDSHYGPSANCPVGLRNANNGTGTDIALIECSDRSSLAPWVGVSPYDDAVGMDTEIRWFHELVYLATDSDEVDTQLQPSDNWAHYGFLDGTINKDAAQANNYHYTNAGLNQLLPFRSRHWPTGAPTNGVNYKAVSVSSQTTEMWTDAFGCHGTSGSGFFATGTTLLFGPTVSDQNAGGGLQWTNRLCEDVNDPGDAQPGLPMLSYIRPSFTRQIEAMSQVQNDRPH